MQCGGDKGRMRTVSLSIGNDTRGEVLLFEVGYLNTTICRKSGLSECFIRLPCPLFQLSANTTGAISVEIVPLELKVIFSIVNQAITGCTSALYFISGLFNRLLYN